MDNDIVDIVTPPEPLINGRRVRFGRLSCPRSYQMLPLGAYLNRAALPTPSHCDWSGKIFDWPMMGNDRLGCCVVAMKAHQLEVFTMYGEGRIVITTDREVEDDYFRETGGPDVGLNIPESLDYWVKNPLGGKRVLAHAAVNYHDHKDVMLVNQLFGGGMVGVNLPADAIPAVQAGRPWTSTRHPADPNQGHAIYLYKTEDDGPSVITWGMKQKCSWDWWDKYVEEFHAVLYAGWYQGASLDPSGIDDAALIADYEGLTGHRPPVPTPVPTPVVPPPNDDPGVIAFRVKWNGRCLMPTGYKDVGPWPANL
jgi:hypothetical protein